MCRTRKLVASVPSLCYDLMIPPVDMVIAIGLFAMWTSGVALVD